MTSAAHAAEQLKEKGNLHFKNGEYESAVTLYSQAIQKNPENPVLWTNRANARLKLKMWHEAMDDCLRSIELNKDHMKGFYFLGMWSLRVASVVARILA
jgi:STIP1 homology and U-box containing protein 1